MAIIIKIRERGDGFTYTILHGCDTEGVGVNQKVLEKTADKVTSGWASTEEEAKEEVREQYL